MISSLEDAKDCFFSLKAIIALPTQHELECGDDNPTVNGINGKLNHLHQLRGSPDTVAQTEAALAQQGYVDFCFFAAGNNAFLLKARDNKIIRLSSDTIEYPRPFHPVILQPFYSKAVGKKNRLETTRVEILPILETDNISDHDAESVSAILKKDGFNLGEKLDKRQFGKLPGTNITLMLDSGNVSRNFQNFKPATDRRDLLKPWIDEAGQWVQFKIFPDLEAWARKAIGGASKL